MAMTKAEMASKLGAFGKVLFSKRKQPQPQSFFANGGSNAAKPKVYNYQNQLIAAQQAADLQAAVAAQNAQYNGWFLGGSGGTSITNSHIIFTPTSAATTPSVFSIQTPNPYVMPLDYPMDIVIHPGPRTVHMPDGSKLIVDANGSYKIEDKDAKVTYQASRSRAFNRFINASDRIEEFIRYCGEEAHITKEEMLEIPIKMFISWLILEAAKADHEPEPEDIKLIPDLRQWQLERQKENADFQSNMPTLQSTGDKGGDWQETTAVGVQELSPVVSSQ